MGFGAIWIDFREEEEPNEQEPPDSGGAASSTGPTYMAGAGRSGPMPEPAPEPDAAASRGPPPTERQLQYIRLLCAKLERDVDAVLRNVRTKLAASLKIEELKAELPRR